jgi:hypothetical protein
MNTIAIEIVKTAQNECFFAKKNVSNQIQKHFINIKN